MEESTKSRLGRLFESVAYMTLVLAGFCFYYSASRTLSTAERLESEDGVNILCAFPSVFDNSIYTDDATEAYELASQTLFILLLIPVGLLIMSSGLMPKSREMELTIMNWSGIVLFLASIVVFSVMAFLSMATFTTSACFPQSSVVGAGLKKDELQDDLDNLQNWGALTGFLFLIISFISFHIIPTVDEQGVSPVQNVFGSMKTSMFLLRTITDLLWMALLACLVYAASNKESFFYEYGEATSDPLVYQVQSVEACNHYGATPSPTQPSLTTPSPLTSGTMTLDEYAAQLSNNVSRISHCSASGTCFMSPPSSLLASALLQSVSGQCYDILSEGQYRTVPDGSGDGEDKSVWGFIEDGVNAVGQLFKDADDVTRTESFKNNCCLSMGETTTDTPGWAPQVMITNCYLSITDNAWVDSDSIWAAASVSVACFAVMWTLEFVIWVGLLTENDGCNMWLSVGAFVLGLAAYVSLLIALMFYGFSNNSPGCPTINEKPLWDSINLLFFFAILFAIVEGFTRANNESLFSDEGVFKRLTEGLVY